MRGQEEKDIVTKGRMSWRHQTRERQLLREKAHTRGEIRTRSNTHVVPRLVRTQYTGARSNSCDRCLKQLVEKTTHHHRVKKKNV